MLREIRYGIDIKLNSVLIDPFPSAPFTYALGQVRVEYGTDKVVLSLPGDVTQVLPKRVTVKNVAKNRNYIVTNSCEEAKGVKGVTVTSDSNGALVFTALFYDGCVITATGV